MNIDHQPDVVAAVLGQLERRSYLFSPKFATRMFAVWGYSMAASVFIYGALFLLALLLLGLESMVKGQ